MKITNKHTPERNIENRINKLGFTLDVLGFLIIFKKPIIKRTFRIDVYDSIQECLGAIEEWVVSEQNPMQFIAQKQLDMKCPCMKWARDGEDILHSKHNRSCRHRKIEKESKAHLSNLLKALEYEASQGDGFSEDYYQAYEDAKFFVHGSILEKLSNCCNEPIQENTDICTKCKEHCEIKNGR